MIYRGLVVSSPPELESSEGKRIVANTKLFLERQGEIAGETSLLTLPMGRRIEGGFFLVWRFEKPLAGPAAARFEPSRAGWRATFHEDGDQLAAFERQARFQSEETRQARPSDGAR